MININSNLNISRKNIGISFPECVLNAIVFDAPKYKSGNWVFNDRINGNDVLIVNNTVAKFSVNDYINTGIELICDSFTLKTRVKKITTFNAGQGLQSSFRTGVKWDSDDTITIYIGSEGFTYGKSDPIIKTDFTEILIIYNGTEQTNADKLKLYVDNDLIPLTFTGDIPNTVAPSGDNEFQIGSGYDLGDFSDCLVDTFEISDKIKYLFCEEYGNLVFDVLEQSNGTINSSSLVNFWSKDDKSTPDVILVGYDLWQNSGGFVKVPYNKFGQPLLTNGDIFSGYSWVENYPAGKWFTKSNSKLRFPNIQELKDADPDLFYYDALGDPIDIGYGDIIANFNNYILWNTRYANKKNHGILIKESCQPLSDIDLCKIKKITDTNENIEVLDDDTVICNSDVFIDTWAERMWKSYITIHPATYPDSIKNEFINRCSPAYVDSVGTGYYYNQFGPPGLDKQKADWILIVETTGLPTLNTNIILRTGERGGLVHDKRWNIDGTIHTSGTPTNFGITTFTGTIFSRPASVLYVKNLNMTSNTFPGTIYFNNIKVIPNKPVEASAVNIIISNNTYNSNGELTWNVIDWTDVNAASCAIGIFNSTTHNAIITSVSDIFLNTIFNHRLTLLTLRDLDLSTYYVDRILSAANTYFTGVIPTRNITINLSGLTMGVPTGDSTNPDLNSIIALFANAGFSATILYNSNT